MNQNNVGYLLIIGGAEDKQGESLILRNVVDSVGKGKLVVLTTATEDPVKAGVTYHEVFTRLGINDMEVLDIPSREDANNPRLRKKLEKADCIFFTGGDQLRITSILGGTGIYDDLKRIYETGGTLVGTSAGASVMSGTMIVEGNDNEPARKCTLKMAPGLGFLPEVIIDQHFDQRGRIGRLLCGIAENPQILGIGIDEDTAIKVFPDDHFEIIGSNAVTIVDGRSLTSTNVSELNPNELLAITGATLHTLPAGYGYHIRNREVIRLKG